MGLAMNEKEAKRGLDAIASRSEKGLQFGILP